MLEKNNGTGLVWDQENGIYSYYENGELTFMGKSYAGGDAGNNVLAVNNPAEQMNRNQGPLPRGTYIVDRSHTVDGSRLKLWPSPGNQMYGRSGFLIHGDALPTGDASKGCAIIQYGHRSSIAHGTLMWVD